MLVGLNAVLDAGINFIDTSVDYGVSEELIGRFISTRRSEYYLATKCGCDPQDRGDHFETPHLWTRDNILRNIEGSLRRMRTDRVDILQFHNPKPDDVRQGDLVDVHAILFVERDSQKGIVIGKGGARLREVGTAARTQIEKLLGTKVYLELRVKIAKNWQRDPKQLGRLGF